MCGWVGAYDHQHDGGSVAAYDGEANALPEPGGFALFSCLRCDAAPQLKHELGEGGSQHTGRLCSEGLKSVTLNATFRCSAARAADPDVTA